MGDDAKLRGLVRFGEGELAGQHGPDVAAERVRIGPSAPSYGPTHANRQSRQADWADRTRGAGQGSMTARHSAGEPLRRRGAISQAVRMSEVSLYPPVKRFLEAAGFAVKGEVKGCDAVAVRDGEPLTLAITEMKLGFTLELLLQAADRMRAADEVWLAVPATRRGRDRDPRVHRLCRLLGFGLMAVNVACDRVEVLVEPAPYRPRPDVRRRARLLSEHSRRRGDPSPGGSTRQPVMTAYRQQALACAALLSAGPGRPRELRAVAPDAGKILLRNVYGWFERTRRGEYRLTEAGEAALRRWPNMIHIAVIDEDEPVVA
jgi:hypothetical protein